MVKKVAKLARTTRRKARPHPACRMVNQVIGLIADRSQPSNLLHHPASWMGPEVYGRLLLAVKPCSPSGKPDGVRKPRWWACARRPASGYPGSCPTLRHDHISKGEIRMKLNLTSALLMALALSTSVLAASDEDAKLATFYRGYLDEFFQQQPYDATLLGEHRFDDRLDDLSAASRAKWMERIRHAHAELPRAVDYARLSRAAQVDYEIFRHDLEKSIWLDENTRRFAEDPRIYTDYINGSVYLLLTQSTLPKETNISNAIARMRQIPRVVAAARENLGRPPRSVLETAIAQNRGSISFYQSEIFELAGDTPQKDALKKAADEVVGLPEGLSGVSRKGRPAAGRRRLAAGQREVHQEARLGARRRADRRRGPCRRRGRLGPRAARNVRHRPATLGTLLSASAASAGQRGRASRDGPGSDRGGPTGAWPAGRPDPRRPCDGRTHPPLHPRSQDPAAARSRPLRSDRDAGVQAGQFDGLHGGGPAAGPRRAELLCRQPAAEGLGRRAGQEPAWKNTTATCSRC